MRHDAPDRFPAAYDASSVDFDDGGVDGDFKDIDRFVRAVRNGS